MDVTDIALCDACYVIGKSAFAGTFCVDCKQKLCTECQMDHNKFPAMRVHKRVPLTDMTAGMVTSYKLSEPISSPLSKCDYHDLKDVGFFCYDHKEVYCSLCRAVKHANCNERPITDVCGRLGTKDLEHVLATLDQLAGGLGRATQERQKQVDEMMTMKKTCIEEIWNLKQRIARLFDLLEKNVDQKVAQVDRCVEGFAEKASLYDDAMHHVMSLSDQVRQTLGCEDQGTIFAAQTKAQKLKTDYMQLVEHYRADLAPVKLVFAKDAHIIDLLSTCESLGDVKLQSMDPIAHVHKDTAQMIPVDMLERYLSKKSEYIPQITARIAPARSPDLSDMPRLQQPRPLPALPPRNSPSPVEILSLQHPRPLPALPPPNSPSPVEILSLQQPRPLQALPPPNSPSPVEMQSLQRPRALRQLPPASSPPLDEPRPSYPTWSQIASRPASKVERKNSASSSSSTNTTNTTGDNPKSFLNIKLVHKKNYPIDSHEEFGDCDITGLAFTATGDLVMCDHYMKSIKVLDQSFQVTHFKRLPDHPWDVTVIDTSEIVLTLTKTKTVKLLRIDDDDDDLHYSGSFFTKKMCWGIEGFHDTVILTCHDNPGNGSVEIRTRQGEVLKQICNDNEEVPLFVTPIYVALDATKERFFVTDGKNNSVICCTASATIEARVFTKTEQLKWPKGIIVDGDSNLVLSAHFANQLKLLRHKGKGKSKSNMLCDVVAPQALTYRWQDSGQMTLVVGSNKGREITVLTFESK